MTVVVTCMQLHLNATLQLGATSSNPARRRRRAQPCLNPLALPSHAPLPSIAVGSAAAPPAPQHAHACDRSHTRSPGLLATGLGTAPGARASARAGAAGGAACTRARSANVNARDDWREIQVLGRGAHARARRLRRGAAVCVVTREEWDASELAIPAASLYGSAE